MSRTTPHGLPVLLLALLACGDSGAQVSRNVQKIPARTYDLANTIVASGAFAASVPEDDDAAPKVIACAVDLLARVLNELGDGLALDPDTLYCRADDLLERLRKRWIEGAAK